MTKIAVQPLPNKIGTADISDPQLKRVAMLFMENFLSLSRQLKQVQAAVAELQKGG